MSEPFASSDRDPGTGAVPGLPRWVKVLGVAVLLLVLVVVVLHLTGNSMGGPGSHLGSAGTGPLR